MGCPGGAALREKIRRGDMLFGTQINASSTTFVNKIAEITDLDWVFICNEHAAHDRQTTSWMCKAYAGVGLPPIVRLPNHDPNEATKVLDGGAAGVIAPYIETAEQVRRLVGATKYRPLKGEKLRRILDGEESVDPDLQKYLDHFNQNHILVANIESQTAIDNLDEILAVPGLDAVQTGPHDLSTSLGVPEQYRHPKVMEALHTIIRKARAAGVGACHHMIWPDEEAELELIRGSGPGTGVNMMIHHSDLGIVRRILAAEVSRVKKKLAEDSTEQAAKRQKA